MKNTIKHIIILFIIIVIFLGGIYGSALLQMSFMEKRGFTKYSLDAREMSTLSLCLDITIKATEDLDSISRQTYYYQATYDITKLYAGLKKGAYSEKLIEEFNKALFEGSNYSAAYKVAKEYGFEKDNPITEMWIMKHPKETCTIILADSALEKELISYYFDLAE